MDELDAEGSSADQSGWSFLSTLGLPSKIPSWLTGVFLQEGDKFFRLAECYVRGNNVSFSISILHLTSSL